MVKCLRRGCRKAVTPQIRRRGRAKTFCSDACRQAHAYAKEREAARMQAELRRHEWYSPGEIVEAARTAMGGIAVALTLTLTLTLTLASCAAVPPPAAPPAPPVTAATQTPLPRTPLRTPAMQTYLFCSGLLAIGGMRTPTLTVREQELLTASGNRLLDAAVLTGFDPDTDRQAMQQAVAVLADADRSATEAAVRDCLVLANH